MYRLALTVIRQTYIDFAFDAACLALVLIVLPLARRVTFALDGAVVLIFYFCSCCRWRGLAFAIGAVGTHRLAFACKCKSLLYNHWPENLHIILFCYLFLQF